MTRPILVTGSHRSGTTWTGKMLCASGEAGYIHEPFNPSRQPGWGGGRIPLWFVYVTPENEGPYRALVERVLRFRYPLSANLPRLRSARALAFLAEDLARSIVYRLRRPRPLIKDPIALFSAEWLASRFSADVVVMIRHPAAFAASIKRLGWHFKFRGWLAQEDLLRDWLHPYEADMRRCATQDVDIIEQAIVMWNAMHDVIRAYRERHPTWIFVRHEDLARAPEERFRALYERLGLRWDERVRRAVARHSDRRNPADVRVWRHGSVRRASDALARAWTRHLTPEEIHRIRAGVEHVASSFYADDEWL